MINFGESRMYALEQSLLVRDTLQEDSKLRLFPIRKRRQQIPPMLPRDPAERAHRRSSFIRQV
jgi:hypothetical protein